MSAIGKRNGDGDAIFVNIAVWVTLGQGHAHLFEGGVRVDQVVAPGEDGFAENGQEVCVAEAADGSSAGGASDRAATGHLELGLQAGLDGIAVLASRIEFALDLPDLTREW